MEQNTNFSALSSMTLLLARGIESYGYDSAELFAQAGLDHSRLKEPLARFSFQGVTRLWTLAQELIDDPCFGIKVASFWHPTTLHALGYSWLASSNLEEAFERLAMNTRIVNTGATGVLEIEKNAEAYRIILDPRPLNPQPLPVTLDSVLAMFLIMCRTAYGEKLKPIKVTFEHPGPATTKCYTDFFEAPVSFSQSETCLWLEPEVVTTPLATANPELVRINDQIVFDYLAQLDRHDLSAQVRSKLIEFLPSGQASEEMIASAINVSQRSLQRKLKQQGFSFTQLLEETRRDLGLQYVRDPQRSFNEIAFLLGFSEPGNFTRAFKRWYGKPPSQYRESAGSKQ